MDKYKSIEDSYRYSDVEAKIQDCEKEIEAEKTPYYGRWVGHGNWLGSEMCFVINGRGVKLAIGRDGDAWIETSSRFDEERGKYIVTYDGGTYELSANGNTLNVTPESGKDVKMAGIYTRIDK